MLVPNLAESKISPENVWHNDRFQRQNFGTSIVNILSKSPKNITVFLKGPYGSGKSYLLRRVGEVAKEDFVVVHIDCLSSDNSGEPLLDIVKGMFNSLQMAGFEFPRSDRADVAKKIAKQLAKRSLGAAVRLSSAGLLDGNDIVKEGGKIISEITEEAVENFVFQTSKDNKARNALNKLFDIVKCKRILIIIDELDRTRPSYAIGLLEALNIFFSEGRANFLIGCDDRFISGAIKSTYGGEIEADEYLRKFSDLVLYMPKSDGPGFFLELCSRAPISQWFDGSSIIKDIDIFEGTFNFIAKRLHSSLRDQERAYAECYLALAYFDGKSQVAYPLIAIAALVRQAGQVSYEFLKTNPNGSSLDRLTSDVRKSKSDNITVDYFIPIERILSKFVHSVLLQSELESAIRHCAQIASSDDWFTNVREKNQVENVASLRQNIANFFRNPETKKLWNNSYPIQPIFRFFDRLGE